MRAGSYVFTKQVDADGPSATLPEVDPIQRYYLEMARRGQSPTTRTRDDERRAFSQHEHRREWKRLYDGGCRCGNPNCGYVGAGVAYVPPVVVVE